MKIKPLHDWAIIERYEPKEKTGSNIIVPDIAQDQPSEGTVVAIGPGRYESKQGKTKRKFVPTTLKPGQRVFFTQYATREIELEGKEIIFVREDDILGIFEDKKQLVKKESFSLEVKEEKVPMVKREKEVYLSITPKQKKITKEKTASAKKKTVSKAKKSPSSRKQTKATSKKKIDTGLSKKK